MRNLGCDLVFNHSVSEEEHISKEKEKDEHSAIAD